MCAADSTDRVFVTNGQDVFAVSDGVPSMYLSFSEVKAAAQLPPEDSGFGLEISDLRVGPDDQVYILVDEDPDLILVSSSSHQVSRLYPDMQAFDVEVLGVESAERLLLLGANGMFEAAPSAPIQIYGEAQIGGGCPGDITVAPDGSFHLISCGFSQTIFAGSTHGGGVGVFLETADLPEDHDWHFVAVAHDPRGGLIVPMTGTVYRFDEVGSPTELPMTPSLEELAALKGEQFFGFDHISSAVGPTGAIYLTLGHTIYRASPELP